MVITKREEKHLSEVSGPLKTLEERILAATDRELPQILIKNIKWDTSKGNLLNWIKILNKFDTILDQITTKYGLSKQYCKPHELDSPDLDLVCAVLDFTYMLLENCNNRSIYASSHRLFDLLNCPTVSIAIKVLSCFVVLGKKFVNQRSNIFIGQRKVSERIYTPGVFLPASTLTANTGSSDNLSLIDYIKEDPRTPKKWKSLEYIYYPNEVPKSQASQNSIECSPSIRRVKEIQSPSPRKKKLPKLTRGERVETFYIPEDEVRKLTLQQMFDKGIERIPEKLWSKFAFRATLAKAFNSNSYENIKLRQDLVILKCLSIAFLVLINREFEVTSRVFEADPTLLSCLIDLINLHNPVVPAVRFAAMKCLECISLKKTWSSEIVRGLGGSVSHGLLFQNLRLLLKQIKGTDEKAVNNDYNAVFFNLIANMSSNKSLAGSLISAGLIQHLSEFINVETKFKVTVGAAVRLLQAVVTSSSDHVTIFRDNQGFTKLINRIGLEVDFAFKDTMGGPPLLSIVNYSISYGQCNFLRFLLKFVHHLLQKESGDTVRNLFDSTLLKDINKILNNVQVFGFTLLTLALNIACSILHNEPTSYPILKEAGTIDIIVDNFSSLLRPSSDLICAIPDLIGAISLNNDGLTKLKNADVITQFFKIFDSHEIAKVIVQNETYEFLAGALDELARHYSDFKPSLMENVANLVKRLADGSTFTLPRPVIYRSEKGAFYHSQEDVILDNEDKCSQLDTWETIEEAYILESAASVVGGLIEFGNSWLTIKEHVPSEYWIKLIVLKNSPFDYLYSNAMYPVNGALKYFDDDDRGYAIQAILDEIVKQVDSVSEYLDSSDRNSVFQSLESDMETADDLFNRLISTNNVLFAFVDVFCNADSLSSTRADQLCRFFSTVTGSRLIKNMGKLLNRVSYEEHILRTTMPTSVGEETIIKEYDDGYPPTRIFDQDPQEKLKHEKTSAKFKNACQIRLVGHRIHSSLAIVFNTLLMLSNMPSEDVTLDPTRWMGVKITEDVTDVFISSLSTDRFQVPDLFLILLYTMHYCFTDSHSDNVLTVPAIILMQKGGWYRERETLSYFWSRLRMLDSSKLLEIKELAYVKNTEESITLSIIMNCLVFFNKLTDYNGMMAVANSSKFYEGDWRGSKFIDVHDLRANLLVQTKLLGFGVLGDILSEEDTESDHENKLPEEVVSEVVKLCKNVFSSVEEKHLGESDGSLFAIDSARVHDSPSKIKYLKSLGMPELTASKVVSLTNGDLSFLDKGTIPNPILSKDLLDSAMDKYESSRYEPYVPTLVPPQYCDYHTLVELQELREAQKSETLDKILRFVQLHPLSARTVSEFLISSFLEAPGQSVEEFETVVLRLILDYIHSFEFTKEDNKDLAGMLHLFSTLILNDTVFFSCHSTLEEFASLVIGELDSEFVNADWFDDAMFSLVRIISGSQLPESSKTGFVRPLVGILKEHPLPFKLDKQLGDRLFEIATNVPDINTPDGALALCRLLTIYAGDTRYAERTAKCGIIEKILRAFSYPKLKEGEKPYALQASFMYLVRRCYETREIVRDMVVREIKQQYTGRGKKESKERTRDLSSVLKDSYGVIMRDPNAFVDEMAKRVRFLDFSESTMKSFTTKMIEFKEEDTAMPDAEKPKEAPSNSSISLESQTGVVHLLLTDLMATVKNDWLSEPPLTEKEKVEEQKRKLKEKESELVKAPKSEISKNEHCAHIIFLLKVLTELLSSYKQSKLEFLTFSKKLFQSSVHEDPKPRSTSLNFLLHQLILAGRSDLPEPELARKVFVGELAVSSIIAFVSTVSGSELKANPKVVDPDLTFMRKFTIDTIHKVLKESVMTAPGLRSMCERVTSLCLTLRSLLSPNEESYLDSSVIEYDAFHLANVVFDSGLSATLTSILSDLDLNFSDYIFPLEAVVNVLSFLGQIKANHQELFKELHPSTGLEEEEVEEDDNDFKEETPDLFQNSTLGMYDVEEIDSDDGYSSDELSFDEDDDDLDDGDLGHDVEIVYSEDDDIIGSESGEIISSDSDDGHSESDSSDPDQMDTDSDESDNYISYNIAPEMSLVSDLDSEEEHDSEGFSEFESDDLAAELPTDDEHEHVFEIDDLNEALEGGDSRGHWMVRGHDEALNEDGMIDFDVDIDDVVDEEDDDEDGLSDDSIAFTRNLPSSRSFGDRARGRHGRSHGSSAAHRDFIELVNSNAQGGVRQVPSSHLNQIYSFFVNVLNERHGRGNPGSILSPPRQVDELKVLSTRDRWTDLASMLGSKNDGLRIYGQIFKKIYEPSREIHEAKVREEEERRKADETEAQKRKEKEEAQRLRELEQNHADSGEETIDQLVAEASEPVWVTIGDRQVDISGTDIDPDFFEALPDDMREDVFTQHIRERRAQATVNGETTREIDQDFLDALPQAIRDEIIHQEALTNRLRAVEELTNQRRNGGEATDTHDKIDEEKKSKQKVFFTPLIDKHGVATLVRYVFIPQSFPARKSLYMLFGQLCLNKQTRSEVLGLMIAILQDGVTSQEALEKTFHQICLRSKPAVLPESGAGVKSGTPRTPTTPLVPKSVQGANHFPGRASPFVVACQILEALQFLLESDPQLRHYFLSEHEAICLTKKVNSLKKPHPGRASKYPLNSLLSLLDIPLVKQKSVLMDGLSRLVQITTRPLEALKRAQDAAEDVKKIELPNITTSSLKNIVTILVSDDCSSRTFQQTLSAMQNLLVVKAHNVFSNELSKLATKLGVLLNKDLYRLVSDLEKNGDDAADFDAEIMLKFTSSSSDQSKLLRVLTALDYLFGRNDNGEQKTDVDSKELTKLYNNLKLGTLWGALSDALDAFESNKNITHIATALLPLIESLMVVCKHSKVKEVQAKDALKYENQKCDFANEPIENLFFSFTNEHKKILNQMVRSNSKLMSGPFAMLVKNPKILEFDNKRNYFDRKLHDAQTEKRTLAISVRRKEVFLDSYRALFFKPKDEFRTAKLDISFKGEAGVDAGGITREWYQVLSRQMFNPDYALFVPVASDKTTFHPNRTSWANPEHLSFFKFVGRIIGKAIFDNCFLDCHFSRDVYKSILGRPVSLKDLETIDMEYYKSLMWMLENDITDIIIETFSVEADDYGEAKIIDLVPNGSNIPVTEENKYEYVRLVVEFRLQKSVAEQVDNFLQGFHEIIPKELISIFDEQELELLISGLPDIDVDDWRNNTNYVNYTANSQEVSYFWRALRSFDTEERAKLLQFATGTSKVPLNGFKELEGASGATKFNIHKDFGSTDRLPSSHTCFNQIDLPAYDSYEKLRKALLLAINEGHEGFGLA